ncbi:MAG: MBL fold metallo-hydrolase [Acidobacteriota bacterium]|nr:MBL fold metallo-hydrolase [Acidobacteriota bacterium]
MKFQLLPSTFDENGKASQRQHLSCFIIDDFVAIDAGSLGMAANSIQKKQIRDVILTHAHIDHIAGLPLFIDDLFATIKKPLNIHASEKVIEILEKNIFNWEIYPKFSELENDNGIVVKYCPFEIGVEFEVEHLKVKAIGVNHKVPAVGFVISDGNSKLAITGDTAEMDEFWRVVNNENNLNALLIECAFPDNLMELAEISHHLTPQKLKKELKKFKQQGCPVYVKNLKPMYHKEIIKELESLKINNLQILEVNKVYKF